MSLQDKIQALQKLADQVVQDKKELLEKVAPIRAAVTKCRLKWHSPPFAQETILCDGRSQIVTYSWNATKKGLFVKCRNETSAHTVDLAPEDLPAGFAYRASVGLDTFIYQYTNLAEKHLAALANSSAPEGAR